MVPTVSTFEDLKGERFDGRKYSDVVGFIGEGGDRDYTPKVTVSVTLSVPRLWLI